MPHEDAYRDTPLFSVAGRERFLFRLLSSVWDWHHLPLYTSSQGFQIEPKGRLQVLSSNSLLLKLSKTSPVVVSFKTYSLLLL